MTKQSQMIQQVCVRRWLGKSAYYISGFNDKCLLLFGNFLILDAFHLDSSPFLAIGKILF